MKQNYIRTSVGFSAALIRQIDAFCAEQRIARPDLIRDAVGHYLTRKEGSPSLSRIATTTEFTQAAVDVLLRHQAPETRDEILLTVEQRMGLFHGQK